MITGYLQHFCLSLLCIVSKQIFKMQRFLEVDFRLTLTQFFADCK